MSFGNEQENLYEKKPCEREMNDDFSVSAGKGVTSPPFAPDGVEEVSLSCSSTSSLGVSVSGSVRWAVGGRPLTHKNSREKDQSEAVHLNKDSSPLISEHNICLT